MPARRKRFIKKNSKKKKIRIKTFLGFIILVFIIAAYISISSDYKGSDKVTVAIVNENGDIQVSTFDWQVEEITNISIPATTQVQLARQLGVLQIKNVWKLGFNEGLQGQLLTETLTRHLKFPVVVWADKQALGLAQGNIASLIKAVFMPYKTNLKIGDRLRIATFSLGVHSSKRVDVNLANTTYLKKVRLIDGEEGYVIFGSFPDQLRVIFSDPNIARGNTKVIIKDSTGSLDIANDLGEVVEILGAKVISIDKEDADDSDCTVRSSQKDVAVIFSRLFSCENDLKGEKEGSADAVILIGREFAERF